MTDAFICDPIRTPIGRYGGALAAVRAAWGPVQGLIHGAGVIADRYVSQGAVVSPGTPVVRLVETTAQEAHIGVAPARAAA